MVLLSPLHYACQNIAQVEQLPQKFSLKGDFSICNGKKLEALIPLIERLFYLFKISGQDTKWGHELTLKGVLDLGNIAIAQRVESSNRVFSIVKIATEALNLNLNRQARIELLSSLVNYKESYFLLIRMGRAHAKVRGLKAKWEEFSVVKEKGGVSFVQFTTYASDPITYALYLRYRTLLLTDQTGLSYLQIIQHQMALKKIQRKYNQPSVQETVAKFIVFSDYNLAVANFHEWGQIYRTLTELGDRMVIDKHFRELYFPGYSTLARVGRKGFTPEQLEKKATQLHEAFKEAEDICLYAYRLYDSFDEKERPPFPLYSRYGQSPQTLPRADQLKILFEYGVEEKVKAEPEGHEYKGEAAALEQKPFEYPVPKVKFNYEFHERVLKRAEEMLDFPVAGKKPEAIFKSQQWRHGFPPLEPFLGTDYSIQDTYINPETKREYVRFIIPGQVELSNQTYEACEFQFSFFEAKGLYTLVHRYVSFPKQEEVFQWICEKQVFQRFEMPSLKELHQMEASVHRAKALKAGNKLIIQQDELLGMITFVDSITGLTFRIFKVK